MSSSSWKNSVSEKVKLLRNVESRPSTPRVTLAQFVGGKMWASFGCHVAWSLRSALPLAGALTLRASRSLPVNLLAEMDATALDFWRALIAHHKDPVVVAEMGVKDGFYSDDIFDALLDEGQFLPAAAWQSSCKPSGKFSDNKQFHELYGGLLDNAFHAAILGHNDFANIHKAKTMKFNHLGQLPQGGGGC